MPKPKKKFVKTDHGEYLYFYHGYWNKKHTVIESMKKIKGNFKILTKTYY